MAYQAIVNVDICWVGDGASQMSVPSAQSAALTIPNVTMPGGSTASAANLALLATAIGTAVGTALLPTALQGQIAAWSTGGQ